ncbi:MAG TPA: diguanylate cyclase [Pirellulales bacterium]|nr:diguanylate cyclase [Pirellulales bacterium]
MKVLVADDEAISRRMLESLLGRWGYDVIAAKDGTEALKILMSPDSPKMAVLDWVMPGVDGPQLCREIRRTRAEPYTYVLLCTGKRTQQDIVAGLEAGADDYLTKPFDPAELKVRLRTGQRILYLQDQLISAREALRDEATHDPLTGLWNRAAVLNILSQELGRSQRQGARLSVLLIDLDHFKRINDAYGHQIGDQVLRQVAQAMRESVRRYDSIGRYGGEEFLVVLPDCDESSAVSRAERLRLAVASMTIETPAGRIRATASFGVAAFDKETCPKSFDLIQAADEALYRAKRNGRNRVELGSLGTALAL